MDTDLVKVQALFDSFDPNNELQLNCDVVLKLLKHIDPGQSLWTPGNISLMFESAAPGCQGFIRSKQFLAWVFSSVCSANLLLTITFSTGDDPVVIKVEPSWRGKAIIAAIDQVVQPGRKVREVQFRGQKVDDGRTASELGMTSGSTLLAIFGDVLSEKKEACPKTVLDTPPVPEPIRTSQPPLLDTGRPASGRKLSLAERRKVAANMSTLAPVGSVSASKPAHSIAPLQRGGSLRIEPLQNAPDEGALIEVMTDTRHNVKTWGRAAKSSTSLWSRRRSMQATDDNLRVATLKWDDLGDVPRSPKSGRSNRSNEWDTILEEPSEDLPMQRLFTDPRCRRHSIA